MLSFPLKIIKFMQDCKLNHKNHRVRVNINSYSDAVSMHKWSPSGKLDKETEICIYRKYGQFNQ